MNAKEIETTYRQHWKAGWGSISINELGFVQDLVTRHRPEHFVEIGMASGLSTGFIARFLDENGGRSITSIDHDNTFFGDPTKANGFLFPEIYKGKAVDSRLLKFKTALDVDEVDGAWQMAFVDANHQHPWPLIDTLALWPKLVGPKLVIHHDLLLYMRQDVPFGIGPKYLHDQFPESHRIVSATHGGNIFCLDLNMEKDVLEDIAISALKLPWSLRAPLIPKYIEKIQNMLDRHYSPRLRAQFDRCVALYNVKFLVGSEA